MNYTQAQIDRANAVSLEDFLRTQGETLIKSGREYRWKEHDSLTVRGNKWFRHSQSKGGYITAMESAPQLKASGLDGDYRVLADFGSAVLAGSPSKYGVQFVTWDWDYDRTGVVHGHYFMENYDKTFALMKKRYAGCEPS